MRWPVFIVALLCVLLAACGGSPTPTTSQVVAALTTAGGANFKDEDLGQSPVPKSYTAHQSFDVPGKPNGAHYFICDTKKNCDAIYAYYDALKALAGPYLYQSPSGTVVAQLSSELAPDAAAKFEAAVKTLP